MTYDYRLASTGMTANEFIARVQAAVNRAGKHLSVKCSTDGSRERVLVILTNLEASLQHGRSDAFDNRLTLVVTGFSPINPDHPAPGKLTLEPTMTGDYKVRGMSTKPEAVLAAVVGHVNALASRAPRLQGTPSERELSDRQAILLGLSPAQRNLLLQAFEDKHLRVHAADVISSRLVGGGMSGYYKTCQSLIRKRLMRQSVSAKDGYGINGVYELTDAGVGVARKLAED